MQAIREKTEGLPAKPTPPFPRLNGCGLNEAAGVPPKVSREPLEARRLPELVAKRSLSI